VKRSVDESMAIIEAAEPAKGSADEALERMVEASWDELGNYEALARGAAEFLTAEHLHRSHAPLLALTLGVIERGQREGVFRTDLPARWLASAYYSLIQGAEQAAQGQGIKRDEALRMLKTTVADLLAAR
jgi:hypothetical protein